MNSNPFLASRAWLLMLLEGAERNGINTIQMEQLHRYIYLANVLSPVCMLVMPESYTLKHMRGPYFPKAQWDIGRLILQGFVESKNFKPFSDDNGFWLAADFRITKRGILCIKTLAEYSYFREQANYLREFMSACSLIPTQKINTITQLDFHYAAASEGEGVKFSEMEGNLSKKAVVLMFPEDRVYTPTEGVHRYINYLDEVSVSS
ncbi:hypothetical protein [Methylophaga nitratireducenticrescens]|uniref:hypothetical protein n=1 Tax=Methylophaga nitratireducenticrescens TaxID=754476 RepID=UPI00059BFF56|nr:hypothetical protein [Methylophaga nitratireducenticrescens]ASF49124.1 hypothetical protein Q7A_03590 [Methylophaga nitratireducenticrescens]AUZ84688.1 hypothetical protein CDW43_08895 [Methylophaga nitratireducenticrescens]